MPSLTVNLAAVSSGLLCDFGMASPEEKVTWVWLSSSPLTPPHFGFEQPVLQLQEKATVSQHVQYRAKGLTSSFCGSVSSKSLSPERNLLF